MSHHRSQHPKANTKPQRRTKPADSGVLPSSMVLGLRRLRQLEPWLPGEEPPWSVVEHYLTYGDDGAGIKEYARHSRVFAIVLEALRNQEEDARYEDIEAGGCPESSPPESPVEG
jgi:hypothetical protein